MACAGSSVDWDLLKPRIWELYIHQGKRKKEIIRILDEEGVQVKYVSYYFCSGTANQYNG